MSSLIKEINGLISKGMYVLLFDIFNGFLKTDVLKTSILSERKSEDMHYLWRAKRYKVYSEKCLFWHYCLQLSLSTKLCLRFLLICFDQEIKDFYQSSLGNEVVSLRQILTAAMFCYLIYFESLCNGAFVNMFHQK